jgi:hypothetical protein
VVGEGAEERVGGATALIPPAKPSDEDSDYISMKGKKLEQLEAQIDSNSKTR